MSDLDAVRRRHSDIPQSGLFDVDRYVNKAKAAKRAEAEREAARRAERRRVPPTNPRWITIKRRAGRHCLDCLAEVRSGDRQYPDRARMRRTSTDNQRRPAGLRK